MIDLSILLGLLISAAFVVNITVQMTKEIIPLPTKLWCIIVSMAVMICVMCLGASKRYITLDFSSLLLCCGGSFVVAYVAMYGFDTLKELWERFKKGENINE